MKPDLPLFLILSSILFQNCENSSTTSTTPQRDTVAIKELPTENIEKTIDTVVYEFSTLDEALEVLEEINYSPDHWEENLDTVPRAFMTSVPPRWNKTSQGITVSMKKHLFFSLLAPLALESNELIMMERNKMLALLSSNKESWSETEKAWLTHLAFKYKMGTGNVENIDFEELKRRVDIIPVSLALAQSASESGWGTSRFADEGNALFGQWTWGKDAIKPKHQREGMGDYGLASFNTPLESIEAYMLNLNTHRAYEKLRAMRNKHREEGTPITGKELANALDKYSERGQDYVDDLHAIIRVNHLAQVDDIHFRKDPTIIMIPLDRFKNDE